MARSFLGSRVKRTLFEVTPARAVGISNFSAFTREEEYILTPGTQLEVTDVPDRPRGPAVLGGGRPPPASSRGMSDALGLVTRSGTGLPPEGSRSHPYTCLRSIRARRSRGQTSECPPATRI
ncbi:hypothetical protein DRB96_14230 [Streptomyces sp. ICC1]|nr:hypothetical protein DRB89_09930 [Streptomyces sp. ICC4]AWZ13283.1 hypothetical protein DRB96_14230 [Streptomyces sp. ICC1]